MKNYFYKLLFRYISLYVLPEDKIIEINPINDRLIRLFKNNAYFSNQDKEFKEIVKEETLDSIKNYNFVLLNACIHHERDIQTFLNIIHKYCSPTTRILIVYYSNLWKPFIKISNWLGLRELTPEQNWIAHEDITNFIVLTDFEKVRLDNRVLIPFWIPFVSSFVNRYLAPLPFFRWMCMVNIQVVRPVAINSFQKEPSVSIVVAARNESGNIENIFKRIPKMGPDDELILIEGNSTDDTWEVIQKTTEKYKSKMNVVIGQQTGKGKGMQFEKDFHLLQKKF